MFRKLIKIAVCAIVLSATAFAQGWETLPLALESAHVQMQAAPDKGKDLQASGELLRLTRLYPQSSLVPNALLIAAQLEQRAGLAREAAGLAIQIVQTYPAADASQPAFDLADAFLNANGRTNESAMLARNAAVGLKDQPQAERFFSKAFDVFRRANMWQEATDIAALRLKNISTLPDARNLLEMSDVALLAGNTAAAEQFLTRVTDRKPVQPEIVSAFFRLGGISSSQGNEGQALEHYTRAWAEFQKCRKHGPALEESVTHDAAQALWELQKPARRELDQLTALDRPLQTKTARRQLASLEEAYALIRDTDAQLAPKALYAMGELHAQIADALLKDGFLRAAGSGELETPAYAAALPEYERAQVFFADAFHKNPTGTDENFCRKAAERAFEAASGKSDAVFAWSLELLHRAPLTATGDNADQARFSYLNNRDVPVVQEALDLRVQALSVATDLRADEQAQTMRQALDFPLKPLTTELAQLCAKQDERTADASSRLSKAFAFALDVSSMDRLADAAAAEYSHASDFRAGYHELLGNVYARLQNGNATKTTLSEWNILLASAYADYSTLCHRVEEDMSVGAANLAPRSDEESQTLRKRLTNLLNQSTQQELASLNDWHTLAARYGIHNEQTARLDARLAELDPAHFPKPDDTPSADRK